VRGFDEAAGDRQPEPNAGTGAGGQVVAALERFEHDLPVCRRDPWSAVEDPEFDGVCTSTVQHLESLNDVVQAITGGPQRETVPDSVVRAAEQVELVNMTPEAHGVARHTATSTPPTRSTPR
jgi:hypothetical protein